MYTTTDPLAQTRYIYVWQNYQSAILIDVVITNSHNLQSTITENLQQYTDQKEELTTV